MPYALPFSTEKTRGRLSKFKSERQRRFVWATSPKAAKKWAHNRKTRKSDWRRAKLSRAKRR